MPRVKLSRVLQEVPRVFFSHAQNCTACWVLHNEPFTAIVRDTHGMESEQPVHHEEEEYATATLSLNACEQLQIITNDVVQIVQFTQKRRGGQGR